MPACICFHRWAICQYQRKLSFSFKFSFADFLLEAIVINSNGEAVLMLVGEDMRVQRLR